MSEDLAANPFARADAVLKFRRTLTPESDRGCGLMAAEYLDSQLKELLTAYFVDDPLVEEEFLPHSRPLGSFSVRIDMAYILGLIGPQARRDLHLIRKIRNDFGHNIDPVTFDHEPIANRCRELHFHAFDKSESPRRVYVQTAMGLVGTIHATIAKTKHIRERVESLVDADRKKRHQEADAAIGKALEVASQSAKGQDVEAAMRAEQQRLFDAAKAALIAAYMPDAESEDRQTEA